MDWETVKFVVGSYCVADRTAFHASASFWHTGKLAYEKWSLETAGDLTESTVVKTRKASIAVRGDCLADIAIPNGGLVHIHGDMKGKLTIGGHSEVVIAGDLATAVEGSGISSVFLGGNAEGYIRHSSSLSMWIEGDCKAEVITGTPSTNLYVGGDFTGTIHPKSDAALLYLVTHGFVSYDTLMNIAKFGYTEFQASVGCSDCHPGYHPNEDDFVSLAINHRPMWLVHDVKDSSTNGRPR